MKNPDFATMQPDDPFIQKLLKKPDHFAYYGEHPFEQWGYGYGLRHRDSNLLDESNADEIEKMLEARLDLEGQWVIEEYSHWAVGWVQTIRIKVLNDDGQVNAPILQFFQDLRDRLDNYPVLNEDDFSNREYEGAYENVTSELNYILRRGEFEPDPEQDPELADKVWRYLLDEMNWDTGSDDSGAAYPSANEILEALAALGYAERSEDD